MRDVLNYVTDTPYPRKSTEYLIAVRTRWLKSHELNCSAIDKLNGY